MGGEISDNCSVHILALRSLFHKIIDISQWLSQCFQLFLNILLFSADNLLEDIGNTVVIGLIHLLLSAVSDIINRQTCRNDSS